MPEIKVVKSEIESVIRELKAVTGRLDSTQTNPDFSISSLSLVNKIQDIEQRYYNLLNMYKNLLLATEDQVWTAIEEFIEAEKKLAESTFK
ncbi:DUF5344 family protein [Bacillus marasmi]|uniref:DUF5344 family protein n=1 Tax=Bacillus marasmi TaxID=1926279 RepID=UPI0011CBC1D0|nr:DUF5344 family protein [Bacillus marasmi]